MIPINDDEDNEENERAILGERIQRTIEILKKRAAHRKRQIDKHGEAEVYHPGTCVWIKVHRRSDVSRRLTKKIHMVYDGPYVIREEIRPNTYAVENAEGDAIGVFNSRLLKSHREAKSNPAAEINMIETAEDDTTIQARRVEEFCRSLKQKIQINKEEDIPTEIDRKMELKKRPRTEEDDSDEDSKDDSKRNLKRKRSGLISEKGMRHISRISNLITDKKLSTTEGFVNGYPMEIILDFRGEFNVITKAALKIIERESEKLQRLVHSNSIPSYLKREKKMKFKAVELEIEAYFETIKEEAMIFPNDVPCVIVGPAKNLDMRTK